MGSPKKRIQYRYDAVGNRVGMTDPDGGRFTYAYDAVNRITQVINPQGNRTSYAYDGGGRRTVKKLANGTRASFSYDAASNLIRLANLKSDGTTISSFNYDYDRVGNRTAVLEADGSRVTWSYDDTYQLTGEHRTGTTPYEDSYTYDAAGNRLLKVHDGARTTYSYDAANQLEWSEDASGRTTYTFDADGNQQLVVEPSGDRTTTSWDYENRTTLVQLPSGIRNTMAYEPGGLRMKLEESTGTKKFVWDDQNYLAETDENDDTQVAYTNEPRLYGNLVSQRRGTDSHWYHFDAIGSTRELSDGAGSISDTRVYNCWGTTVSSTGNSLFPCSFIGQRGYYSDDGLLSHYVRARNYIALLARWTSRDALSPFIAPYRYAANSPIMVVDPSGDDDLCILPVEWYIEFHCFCPCDFLAYWDDFRRCARVGDRHARDWWEEFDYDRLQAHRFRALQQCIAGACAAVSTSCECGYCLGVYYEGYKTACEGGLETAERRANWNRATGRECVGCSGGYKAEGNAFRNSEIDEIVKCCRKKLRFGCLWEEGDDPPTDLGLECIFRAWWKEIDLFH